MVCPHCKATTDVTNSRQQRRVNGVWRRRMCTACNTVFTTLERADLSSLARVARSPTSLEPFSRDRLFLSLYESCRHRASAITDASNLTQQVIARLLDHQDEPGSIGRNSIVQTSLNVLKKFDKVAATYYAAYHPL